MADKLNVIVIQIDSLNRHFLTTYGNDWVKAPNLHAFAQKAAVFDQHYTGSLPCMPARREIWAGAEEFWWRFWGPLEPWDESIAYHALNNNIISQLVTDHYHFFEWGSHSFYVDFDGYEFIRGHEHDTWKTTPIPEIPDWAQKMVERGGDRMIPYIRNVLDFTEEADFFGPKVMQSVADWLEANHSHEQFYLHVDSFDVHEPFHIPEPYRSMYTDGDYTQYSPWPRYGRTDEGPAALSDEEIEWVRAQFAGKLTMVDTWLGRVFDKLTEHDLWDNTCVIITTDHGHYLGEHNWMGKPEAPLYHTLCHIPMLVWHPQGAHNGGRVNATTQTVDLYATVLELLGLSPPQKTNVHSRSFAPVLTGQRDTHRDYAVYGYFNSRIGITKGDWTLLRAYDGTASPGYLYTYDPAQNRALKWITRDNPVTDLSNLEAGHFIPGVDTPVWRIQAGDEGGPSPDLLFNNADDPAQENDLSAVNPDKLQELQETLRAHVREVQAPEEQMLRLRL